MWNAATNKNANLRFFSQINKLMLIFNKLGETMTKKA